LNGPWDLLWAFFSYLLLFIVDYWRALYRFPLPQFFPRVWPFLLLFFLDSFLGVGFGGVVDVEVMVLLAFDFEVSVLSLEDFSVQELNVADDESLHSPEVLLVFNCQADVAVILEVLCLVLDVFLLEIVLKGVFEYIHVLLSSIREVKLSHFNLQLGRFRVAALMEGTRRLAWILGSVVYFFQQFQSLELGRPAHVMAFVSVVYFEVVDLPGGGFELDPFAEGVEVGRIALLHDDLSHVFSLEVLAVEDGDELHGYFLPTVEVYLGVHLLQECFQQELEGVLLLSLQDLSLDCALAVLDSNVDGASAGVEEGYNGFEECSFALLVLERQLKVLVFSGEVFQFVFLPIVEGGSAPHAFRLLH
jgi:hypothetical protein